MRKVQRLRVMAVLTACLGAVLPAGAQIDVGVSRATVTAKLGQPTGVVNVGTKEILTFPVGRVTLENGIVRRFEPLVAGSTQSSPVLQKPVAAPRQRATHQTGWISNLREAKARATEENKPILFLVTGDLSVCPWGTYFSREVQSSSTFVRLMAPRFILFRLDLSNVDSGAPAATLAEAEQRHAELTELLELRAAAIANISVPALAILSADATQSIEVNMTGALAAKEDMLNYTIRAVDAAAAQPRKEIGSIAEQSKKRFNMVYVGIGVLVVGLLLKRIIT